MGAMANKIEKEAGTTRLSRILCLEDNQADRDLLEAMLEAEGIPCGFVYASTREQFEHALQHNTFDLIISDFTLPQYDGMSALAMARKFSTETPFIFVSGTIGEDRAVETLKNGATDYVLKDRRDRLISAVQRALREGQERIERKKLEEQLRQAQKMEAIGQLAGGVAHDFNNLLAVIQGNAELALMTGPHLDDRTREFLKQITEASGRAANLTRQLLAFGRKHNMRLEPLNLKNLISNLAKMLKRIIGEDVHLDCHCDGQPFIRADTGMIEQVILNLVVNSRDAMPQGGRVQITAKIITIDEGAVPPHPAARAGEFVSLKVSDTGTGIAPEHLRHIFEPFFTTKEVGKGTGLGLATVYGIVKQHQGWVDVASQVGEGTTFEIFLPSIQSSVVAIPAISPELIPCGGTEKILLVEDDDAVRLMTRRTLESFGYQVLEAASGRKALEIWQTGKLEIDLLLTDIVMPDGLTGRRLAELLREQTPGLKVIFVSGYSLSVISKDTDFLNRRNNYFLQKPYQANVLMDAIRHCLDQTTFLAA
jgi:two-component system cell cycle sensor histidine kinase/response regulator CckA